MKKILLSTALLSTLLAGNVFAADAPKANQLVTTSMNPSPFPTEEGKLSYAIGYNMGKGLRAQQITVDQKILNQGISNGLAGETSALSPAETQAVMTKLQQTIVAKQMAAFKAAAAKNLAEGTAFMKANAAKPGVKSIDNDQIQYRVVKEGTGPLPKLTDKIDITYEGKLVNGTVFDSSARAGDKPVALAVNQMIPGMQKLLTMMPVGSTWEMVIAPSMAYGEQGVPMSPIGPNSTLIFNLTIKDIAKNTSPAKKA